MAAGDLSGPGGVISADPGGANADQGAAASAGPRSTMVVATAAAGTGASTGAAEALVVAA